MFPNSLEDVLQIDFFPADMKEKHGYKGWELGTYTAPTSADITQ